MRAVEPGRITAKDGRPVAGAAVSAYFFDSDAKVWRLWDGKTYGQENPQRTGPGGEFRYFLPPGTYELRVRAPGYRRAKTSPMVLNRPSLITLSVPLEPAGFWENIFNRLESFLP